MEYGDDPATEIHGQNMQTTPHYALHCDAAQTELDSDGTNHLINTYSTKVHATGAGTLIAWYPHDKNAIWDLTVFNSLNVPSLNFKILRETGAGDYQMYIRLCESDTKYFEHHFHLATAQTWEDYSIPVGTYSNSASKQWTPTAAPNAPNWNNINFILFALNPCGATDYFCIDGLHFGGSSITRIARQCFPAGDPAVGTLGDTDNPMRFKVITDNEGKDDSLVATNDSGLMAQLAKAELMKLVTTPTLAKFTTPMLSDWLPGQFAYIGSTNYRVTKLKQIIKGQSFQTQFEATTDTTNSHSRRRFEDVNKIYAAIRPEYQDRQASSLKSGSMDIRIAPLEYAYDI
jgi:hypothetical protein